MVNFTNRSINNNNNNNNEGITRVASRNVKSPLVVGKSPIVAESSQKMKGASMKKASDFDGANKTMTGRNTFAFWTIVWLIFVLAVGNLCLTLTIFGVLRLSKGMEFMELVPEADAVKFFGSVDLDRIYKKDGLIEGFYDIPLTITGDKSHLALNMIKSNGHMHNRMFMSKNGTQFSGINQFDLRDSDTDELLFTTHKPTYNLQNGADNLVAKVVSASRVTSSIGDDLVFNQTNHNKSKISIRGSEGVRLNAKEMLLDGENVQLKTHNGSIFFTNNNGIYLDVKRVPIVQEKSGIRMEEKQYKICVCMPEGKLFRVALPPKHNNVRDVCNYANLKYDPCM